MKLVGITQRVVVAETGERRDALDQRWTAFLARAGLRPLPLPNDAGAALDLVRAVPIAGLVLTGGNDLAAHGGDAAERDDTELHLLEEAAVRGLPVLAVCRGMQLLVHEAGGALERVEGHVAPAQEILVRGAARVTNSYHRWGTRACPRGYEVWAVAHDGVIEAIESPDRRVTGVMWHPERREPPDDEDLALLRARLGGAAR